MCGIHGVINKSNITISPLNDFMEQGFVVNTLRGVDSSGVFQIDRQHRKYMHKQQIPGFNFAETKTAKRFFKDVSSSLITVGHVRAATHGKVTTDNAHPFIIDRADGSQIIGVHNGSLSNWKSQTGASAFDVDSEWALQAIANDGIDALEKMNGSYAFIWWDDKDPNKLQMVRNEERPLHFVRSKSKDAIMFGSEAGMLAWLAERNKIETGDMIYSLEPHQLYSFDLSKQGSPITWAKVNAPKYKVATYVPVNNGAGTWNAQKGKWEGGGDTGGRGRGYSSPTAYDRDRDDWEGWESEYYGQYHNNGTGAHGGSAPNTSFPRAAEAFCERFKKAVGDNRDKRRGADRSASGATVGDGSSGVSPGDSGIETPSPSKAVELRPAVKSKLNKKDRRRQAAINRATAKESDMADGIGRAELDSHGDAKLPPTWFSDQDATTVERNQAKSMGVYGDLQWFMGIAYEPQTGELLGEIEEFVVGTGKIKHPAVLRCHSARSAQAIMDSKGTWTAIIGRLHDLTMKSYIFVMAELTDTGKEGMIRMAS